VERVDPKRHLARTLVVTIAALSLAIPVTVEAARRGAEPDDRRGSNVVKVKMKDDGRLRFKPASITVDRGTKVKFVNAGNLTHTTTSDDDLWDERLAPGDKFTRRFRQMGTFEFHCTIHRAMTGTITVT
jgi:plastocyanin